MAARAALVWTLALECTLPIGAFAPQPTMHFSRQGGWIRTSTTIDAYTTETQGDDDQEGEQKQFYTFGGLQSATNEATMLAKNLVEKGSSDALSVTKTAVDAVSGVAEKGTSGVKSVASDLQSATNDAASRAKGLVERGSSDARLATKSAVDAVSDAAERGTSGVMAVANTAASSLTGIVGTGASNVRSAAEIGASRVKEIAEGTTTNAGEVVKWMDAQAKGSTSIVNAKAQSLVLGFTRKGDYQFGDVTKELVRRAKSSDISIADVILLLKVLLMLGACIGPLAEALPVAVLLQALNLSLEKQVGGKLLEVLAVSLDARFIAAFTGDDKFQLGDFAKRSMIKTISGYTGKDTYEPGDIKRAVANEGGYALMEGDTLETSPNQKTLDLRIDPAFEEWDKMFVDSHNDMERLLSESLDGSVGDNAEIELTPKELDMAIASELDEWNAMFRETYL